MSDQKSKKLSIAPQIYVIMGNPIPLARARFGKRQIYDAQKHQKFLCGIQIRTQHDEKPFYEGPLSLSVNFFMPLPQMPKLQKALIAKHYHDYKPDLSNMLKFIEDVCTGILYKDDASISHVVMAKTYDKEPRVEFSLRELKGECLTSRPCDNCYIFGDQE
jgi:Holliday junction resolvase RusA-like endonuclease